MALTFAVLLVNLQDQSRHILRKSGSAPSNRWLHDPQKLDSKGEKTVLPHRGATSLTVAAFGSFIDQITDCRITSHSILPQTSPLQRTLILSL